MVMKNGMYGIFPGAQQLRTEDGSPGKWAARATVIRWQSGEVMPVNWTSPEFESKQAALAHAVNGARAMIDSGRCTI
jgi:hypothetical protein